jgi:hypothetical protein
MTDNDYRGLVIAVGALAVSALVFFLTQLKIATLERPMLEAQRTAAAARKASMQEGIAQEEEAFKQREVQLQQVQKLEAEYAQLLTDLLELEKIDPDARDITLKWKIQQQGQPVQASDRTPATPIPERKEKSTPAKGAAGKSLAPG